VAQSALSRQIQDLEEEVGFKLFERLPRAGKLSLAGLLFLEDARRILQEVSEAAARAARGQSGTLRIGFTENASWRGVVPDSFRRFREQQPDAELQLQPAPSLEQLEAIRSGRLDVGFLNFMPKADLELDQLLVATQRVELAVPKRHFFTKLKKLLSLAKMLSGANAFRIRGTSSNPRTVCNNVTCSAAGQITIRQPQVAYLTAQVALTLASFGPGKTVQAPAIGGSVGNAVTQLARALGAKHAISSTTNHAKAEQAKVLGFDEVMDTSLQKLGDGVRRITDGYGADVVIDGIGGEILSEALKALALGGSLTTLGYSASRKTTIDVTDLIVPQASIRSLNMFRQPQATVTDAWNAIVSLLQSGAIKPIVAKTFPLAEAAEALRYLVEGRPFGRVVLTV